MDTYHSSFLICSCNFNLSYFHSISLLLLLFLKSVFGNSFSIFLSNQGHPGLPLDLRLPLDWFFRAPNGEMEVALEGKVASKSTSMFPQSIFREGNQPPTLVALQLCSCPWLASLRFSDFVVHNSKFKFYYKYYRSDHN